MVVIHFTGMESGAAALERLCDPSAEVSAHYLIDEDGGVLQLVDEELRAWHAGAGAWGSVSDVNSRSVGIELVNDGASAFPEAQMAALEDLLAGVCARWQVPPERVIGHSDCAPARKVDPGPLFDWRRLAETGLSIWPEAAEPGDFLKDAARFGYRGEAAEVLRAFRLRFRPEAAGDAGGPEELDARLMADLARRWPAV